MTTSSPHSPPVETRPGDFPLSSTDPSSSRAAPPSPAWPLAIWLLLQAAALLLAAARIPLSANYSRAGEQAAMDLMLTAQIVGAALLFPLLLRDWRAAVAVTASAWPFVALAATLSCLPAGRTVAVGMYVTVWLATLALWRAGLPSPKWRMIAAAIAGLMSAGGALLYYLACENATQGQSMPTTDGRFGPLVGAFNWKSDGPHPIVDSLGLVSAFVAGLIVAIISWRFRSPATLFVRGRSRSHSA